MLLELTPKGLCEARSRALLERQFDLLASLESLSYDKALEQLTVLAFWLSDVEPGYGVRQKLLLQKFFWKQGWGSVWEKMFLTKYHRLNVELCGCVWNKERETACDFCLESMLFLSTAVN